MGLIGDAILIAGAFGAAHEFNKYKARKNGQLQQPMYNQQTSQRGSGMPYQETASIANAYAHQQWCNGTCYGRCNGDGTKSPAY